MMPRLFAPYLTLLVRSEIQERGAYTGAVGISVEEQNLISLFPPKAVSLGFKSLSVDDEELIIVNHFDFISRAA